MQEIAVQCRASVSFKRKETVSVGNQKKSLFDINIHAPQIDKKSFAIFHVENYKKKIAQFH